jgi:hypothetical protein
MHQASKQSADRTERLLVIQLLSQPKGRERDRLYDALGHIERDSIDNAINSLQQAGVLNVDGERVSPSAALSCLERLEMIGV